MRDLTCHALWVHPLYRQGLVDKVFFFRNVYLLTKHALPQSAVPRCAWGGGLDTARHNAQGAIENEKWPRLVWPRLVGARAAPRAGGGGAD